MKFSMLAAPLSVLLATGAFAQTSTTEGSTEGSTGAETSTMQSGSMMYGTDWSTAIGDVIYSDTERTQLRTTDEIVQRWPSLPQEDRDKVLAECERFKTDTNATDLTDGSSDATAGTGTDATTGTAATDTGTATTGTATTDTGTAATGTATTDTSTDTTTGTATGTGTDASTTVGYDSNAMMVLCPAIENL